MNQDKKNISFKKSKKKLRERGFIKLIIIIVIALIILGYFGFDIKGAVESPTAQSNLKYFGNLLSTIWNDYLKAAVLFVWNGVVVKFIWPLVLSIFTRA